MIIHYFSNTYNQNEQFFSISLSHANDADTCVAIKEIGDSELIKY